VRRAGGDGRGGGARCSGGRTGGHDLGLVLVLVLVLDLGLGLALAALAVGRAVQLLAAEKLESTLLEIVQLTVRNKDGRA